jgi:hypothetical protein
MIALIFLLLFSTNLLTASQSSEQTKPSVIKKSLVEGAMVVALTTAHVVAGPIIYPSIKNAVVKATEVVAFPVAATAAAVVTAYPYVVAAAPYVGYAQAGYWTGCQAKKYLYPSKEQQVERLRMDRALEKPFDQQLRKALYATKHGTVDISSTI